MSKPKTETSDPPATHSQEQAAPKQPRLTYTGQTEGGIVIPGHGVVEVHPGKRVTPQDDAHRDALLATGHFRAPDPKETA